MEGVVHHFSGNVRGFQRLVLYTTTLLNKGTRDLNPIQSSDCDLAQLAPDHDISGKGNYPLFI